MANIKRAATTALLMAVVTLTVASPALAGSGGGHHPDYGKKKGISVEKTAEAHWEREYVWEITKTVEPDNWVFQEGDSGVSTYTIVVTPVSYTDSYSVSGEICVTNYGKKETQNLTIVDVIQYKKAYSGYRDYMDVEIDISQKPSLGPGETYCYPYDVEFEPHPDAVKYRNKVYVSAGSGYGSSLSFFSTGGSGGHDGHDGSGGSGGHGGSGGSGGYGGSTAKDTAVFYLPDVPDVVINGEVNVVDDYASPGDLSDDLSWGPVAAESGGDTFHYDRTFTCEDEGETVNTATIVETGQSDDATVTVACEHTPPPPPPPDEGWRTQTQGGWGTRAQGNNPGVYRDANFPVCFAGGLTVGNVSGFTATFTTSLAIQNYLPAGGPPAALDQNYVDPASTSAGVLGGQVVALTLNVGFDLCDPDFSVSPVNLADLVVADAASACYGWTVQQILDEANLVLSGGGSLSPSAINGCATGVNESFVDGGPGSGFLTTAP